MLVDAENPHLGDAAFWDMAVCHRANISGCFEES
jgi:hypothetical protein